nr:hypothetical protein [Tanacetum cinerariifolium]
MVIITESSIRYALRLDDAEGRQFNFSKYIVDSLVRNVDSSTKFYMYPRFLQHMIRKQVGDLYTYTTKYTSPTLTQKVFSNMRRVGKGFSRVEIPLFEGMIVVQEVADEVHVDDVPAVGIAAEGDVSTANDEVPTAEMMIADIDADVDVKSQAKIYKINLEHAKKVLSMKEEESEPTELQKVVDVVTTAKIISEGVVIRDHQETAPTSSTIIHSEAKSKDKGKGILVEEPKPLKKQAQIEQDEKYARELEAELNKNIDWDEVIDHVKRKQKEDNAVKRYQALKKKPQTEAQARKNMMIYLRNVVGFKMDYFKGMTYDDIRPIFEKHFDSNVAFLQKTKEQMDEEDNRVLKRLNESQEDKAAKKQKLDEEVEKLKRHLQIVPNDEDDVYTEATPLGRKVPAVDYEIYNENNKPYYKIKRADGSHQLYLSFLSLLR